MKFSPLLTLALLGLVAAAPTVTSPAERRQPAISSRQDDGDSSSSSGDSGSSAGSGGSGDDGSDSGAAGDSGAPFLLSRLDSPSRKGQARHIFIEARQDDGDSSSSSGDSGSSAGSGGSDGDSSDSGPVGDTGAPFLRSRLDNPLRKEQARQDEGSDPTGSGSGDLTGSDPTGAGSSGDPYGSEPTGSS